MHTISTGRPTETPSLWPRCCATSLSQARDQDAATGRWTAAESDGHLALPHSVRAVIGTRVSRLGEEATKVLSTASVIGRDFDLDLLAETTVMDEEDLIDLLEQAQHAALVNELADSPGRYSFSHALIQHTLYEDMGGTRRTRAHRAVGEAIERLYKNGTDDVIGELARHFLLATRPTDVHKAIVYSQAAGEAALAALAPDEAVRYFSQALELASHVATVDPTVRIDLLIDLGTAQRQSGIPAFRENLLEAADAHENSATPIGWSWRPWPTAAGGSAPSARSTSKGSKCSRPLSMSSRDRHSRPGPSPRHAVRRDPIREPARAPAGARRRGQGDGPSPRRCGHLH